MGDKEDSLAAKLEEIRQMFLQRLNDEWLTRLINLRRKLPSGDWSRPVLDDMLFLTHTLAGSGATFGYKAISDVGRKIEITTRAMIRDEASATAETRSDILNDLELLEAESRRALGDLRPRP
jgi:HPt (histidine-containing phosphotransfer) domain-containing protein